MSPFVQRVPRHRCELPRGRFFKPLDVWHGDEWECSECGRHWWWLETWAGDSWVDWKVAPR